MAANFLHGVETIEIQQGPRPIRQVKTAVVGLVGTAPTPLVAAEDRTLNSPVLVLNDRDAARYFGAQIPGYTIPQALNAIFDQGAGLVVVINVFDPSNPTHFASITDQAKTLNDRDFLLLNHKGVWDVVVTNSAGSTTYVLNTDYRLDPVLGKIIRIKTGAITAGQALLIDYKHGTPENVTNGQVIGAVDGFGNRTGMQALLDAYSLFGFYPKVLIAPVFSGTAAVATEMDVIADKVRAVALVDAPAGATVQQAIEGRGPAGALNLNYSSDRMVICYPYVKTYNPVSDALENQPLSQRLAGVICAKDLERGYWWSPSNTEIKGIVGIERNLTAMINDPGSEVNLLNEVGIVTVFNSFGTGLRTWGNRSAAWPSVTAPVNFINIRRTADVIHESVEFSMLQFIDFPIDNGLIDSVTQSVNSFLRTLMARGAIIDGNCSYDPNKNPATELALGHLTFDITFMPPPPAERITFESFIDINFLNQLGRPDVA